MKTFCRKRYSKENQMLLTARLSQPKNQSGPTSTRDYRKSFNLSNPFKSTAINSTNHKKRYTMLPPVSQFEFLPCKEKVSLFDNEHDDTADILAMLSRVRIEKAQISKTETVPSQIQAGSMPAKLRLVPSGPGGALKSEIYKPGVASSNQRVAGEGQESRQVVTSKPKIKIARNSLVKGSNNLTLTVQPFNPAVRIRTRVHQKINLSSMRNPLGVK